MDFPSALKKSFKSHGSYKHAPRIPPAGAGDDDDDSIHEQLPILSDIHYHHHQPMSSTSSSSPSPYQRHRDEFIVNVDGGGGGGNNNDVEAQRDHNVDSGADIWMETANYEFWRDGGRNGGAEKEVMEDPRFSNSGGGGGGGGGFGYRKEVVEEDPPSRLMRQFLNKQKDAGVELSLDMELEMDELRRHGRNPSQISNHPTAESPVRGMIDNNNSNESNRNRELLSRELRVSFVNPHTDSKVFDIEPEPVENNKYVKSPDEFHEISVQQDEYRRRTSFAGPADHDDDAAAAGGGGDGDGDVLRCTSSFRRASIARTKTMQSRLLDPIEPPPERKQAKAGRSSGQLKSGLLARASGMLSKLDTEEEEDPLFDDEDIPEDFKKTKLDALTLIQWISLVVIISALSCTLAIGKWKRQRLRGLQIWKWEVLVLVLICGRLVSGWAIRFVVFFVERNFLLRKRVLYFVYGIRKAVQNCIWLGLVLIAWHLMFDKKVEGTNKFLRYVNKLMVCMLVATLLWLVKTLVVKVLASSFHVSTFFDRIHESLFNQYVIETLSGPPVIEIQLNQEEEDRTMAEIWKLQNAGATMPPDLRATALPPRMRSSGRAQRPPRGVSMKFSGTISSKKVDDKGQTITIDHLHRLNPTNVSAWNMKRLMNIVRHGALATLDEQVLGTAQEEESGTEIRSEVEAKRAARKIFLNVARRGSKFIYLDDLMRFLREDEALKAMGLLEGSSESEKISKSALKNWVVNAFRERKALALTLNDTKTAVNKLHSMVNVLVGIIIVIICLLILGIATSKILLFVSSQIVVVAFIFGNTCKTVFEAIIFVFVMHPFDVGDRCEIDGVQMIVEEMNILTTVFLRFDNQKILYPNSTLATRPISNYYRSPDMGDSVEFCIHIATPDEKIAQIKQRIIDFVESNKDYWYAAPKVVTMQIEELNRLRMAVWLRHKINHQDMGEKWIRRAIVVDEMVSIFKELDIEYRLYPLDINVRALPNSASVPSTWAAPAKYE